MTRIPEKYCFTYDLLAVGHDFDTGFDVCSSASDRLFYLTVTSVQVYNIPDALAPEAPMDGTVFLNSASL